MSDTYILKSRTPAPEPDIIRWARWFETADRQVALTRHELFTVSTVFLGLDHRFHGKGPPLLFETMMFADNTLDDIECSRYATWDDAEAGHKAMVRRMLARAAMAEEQARVARFAEQDRELRRIWCEDPVWPVRVCAGCGAEQKRAYITCEKCRKPLVFPRRSEECSPTPRSTKPSKPSRSRSRSTNPSR